MFSENQNPERAAVLSAVLNAIIVFVLVFIVVETVTPEYYVLLSIIVAFIAAILNFFVVRFVVGQLVYSKIKLIYKTIHGIKKIGKNKEGQDQVDKISLSQVEQEVELWARKSRLEIAELDEREKFRREYLGNVSHELKTPIFNIQGYILSLIDGGLEDPNVNRKYLIRASKSVDRMINLVEDMDTLNKLESGVVEVKYRPFKMVDLIKDVLDSLEDHAANFKIKLQFSVNKKVEHQKVLADPNRIEQVVVNLIMNAIKYSNPNSTVTIRLLDFDTKVLVEVADQGVGIPNADLGRIFERFYRVDKSRTRDAGGSGLGLSIIKHIIDAHQESINVESSEGVGSTFSFTLKKA